MTIKSIKDIPTQFGGAILGNVLKDILLIKDKNGYVVVLLKFENNDIFEIQTQSKEIATNVVKQNLNN